MNIRTSPGPINETRWRLLFTCLYKLKETTVIYFSVERVYPLTARMRRQQPLLVAQGGGATLLLWQCPEASLICRCLPPDLRSVHGNPLSFSGLHRGPLVKHAQQDDDDVDRDDRNDGPGEERLRGLGRAQRSVFVLLQEPVVLEVHCKKGRSSVLRGGLQRGGCSL